LANIIVPINVPSVRPPPPTIRRRPLARPPSVRLGHMGRKCPMGTVGPMSPLAHGTIDSAPRAPQGPWDNNDGRNNYMVTFVVVLQAWPFEVASNITMLADVSWVALHGSHLYSAILLARDKYYNAQYVYVEGEKCRHFRFAK